MARGRSGDVRVTCVLFGEPAAPVEVIETVPP